MSMFVLIRGLFVLVFVIVLVMVCCVKVKLYSRSVKIRRMFFVMELMLSFIYYFGLVSKNYV